MRFRNIRAEELEGTTTIPGLEEWLHRIGATDTALLILAPPGAGKSAAVGKIAHRLGRNVMLCNLLELFESAEPARQLENLLRLCEAERNTVIFLDRLDEAAERWGKNAEGTLDQVLTAWLRAARPRLLDDGCTVVCAGRRAEPLSPALCGAFDKVLTAGEA
jgi:SpoVK/Ycf46/Vps4 family AAA+-type ATPase